MTTTGEDKMYEIEKISEQVRVTKEAVGVLKAAHSLILDKDKRKAIDEKSRVAEITLNRCSIKIAKLTEIQK